tara:strand:+ start:359 stop:466 length:108 start_codon:yes stop_codon:yes gene_type:complete
MKYTKIRSILILSCFGKNREKRHLPQELAEIPGER